MTPLSLATLSFLLHFSFLTNLPLLAFSIPETIVRDSYGNQIFPGYKYNILPVDFSPPPIRGGLRLAKTGNSSCPVTILQDDTLLKKGMQPIHFTLAGINIGIIYTGNPLVIDMRETKPECASSATWAVFEDKKLGVSYVGLGGPKDHPGKKMLNGTFNFQKLGNGYKLMFCQDYPSSCMDIGRYDNHEGGKRLYLTKNQPYNFVIYLMGIW